MKVRAELGSPCTGTLSKVQLAEARLARVLLAVCGITSAVLGVLPHWIQAMPHLLQRSYTALLVGVAGWLNTDSLELLLGGAGLERALNHCSWEFQQEIESTSLSLRRIQYRDLEI